MAFRIWGYLLRNSHSVVYLDNEAAQAALVAGSGWYVWHKFGTTSAGIEAQQESEIMRRPWFDRVASSNPSDDPSRGVFDHLVPLTAAAVLLILSLSFLLPLLRGLSSSCSFLFLSRACRRSRSRTKSFPASRSAGGKSSRSRRRTSTRTKNRVGTRNRFPCLLTLLLSFGSPR